MTLQTPQRLAILGSTGSIGTQTLDIVRSYPDRFEVTTLSACNHWQKLVEQAIEFQPDSVVIANTEHYKAVHESLSSYPIKVYAGDRALEEVVCSEQVDTVVVGLVGYSGLFPTASALKHGKKVALANKECLVVAGDIITRLSVQHQAPILPVDSEHSAIFQCLNGEHSPVEKVILTASGGPFLYRLSEEFEHVTVEEALHHPNWNMGAKVTIDSASLMNKGFEVIEARWLFGLKPDQIEVVIHPGSVIHSMVQFCDGAVMAQIGTPDMHLPIQYALTYPQRLSLSGKRVDFCDLRRLEFIRPDRERFPNLTLAYECLQAGGNAGAILNAANEVAVEAFLQRKIRFADIARINAKVLDKEAIRRCDTLEEYHDTDVCARRTANQAITRIML